MTIRGWHGKKYPVVNLATGHLVCKWVSLYNIYICGMDWRAADVFCFSIYIIWYISTFLIGTVVIFLPNVLLLISVLLFDHMWSTHKFVFYHLQTYTFRWCLFIVMGIIIDGGSLHLIACCKPATEVMKETASFPFSFSSFFVFFGLFVEYKKGTASCIQYNLKA